VAARPHPSSLAGSLSLSALSIVERSNAIGLPAGRPRSSQLIPIAPWTAAGWLRVMLALRSSASQLTWWKETVGIWALLGRFRRHRAGHAR